MSATLQSLVRRTLDTSESNRATPWGLLILRGCAGAMIFYIHGWHKLLGGIAYLRDGVPWKLAQEVAEMHTPAPLAAAFLATAVQFVCSLFLVAGLFTRINAALLVGALAGAIMQNLLAARDPQLAILYTLIMATFVVAGPGRFSCDALWLGRRVAS